MNNSDLVQRAEAALARGDMASAAALYGRAMDGSSKPSAAALLGWSSVLLRLGRHGEAHQAVLAALRTGPADPAVRFRVTQRLAFFCEHEVVHRELLAAQLADSAPPQACAEAAMMLLATGAEDDARALLDSALGRAPDHPALRYVSGNLHAFLGEPDLAEAEYVRCLASDRAFAQAHWMRAGLRRQVAGRSHVDEIRAARAHVRPGGMGEVYLGYALHKELHDLGDFSAAWDALAAANAVKRKMLSYAPGDTRALVDALGRFAARRVATPATSHAGGSVPVFIVGMHRSGTTLLERILGGHSQIADAGETYAFAEQLKRATNIAARGVATPGLIDGLSASTLAAAATGYRQAASWLARGKAVFTEKLPSNFLLLGAIAASVPQARFIHLARDPLDTCFSNLRTLFAEAAPYSYDQSELADFFQQYRAVMALWREHWGDRILDVSYAELVQEPALVARRVFDFCGLEFEDSALHLDRPGRAVATASAALVRGGFDTGRGRAWEPYADQLAVLRAGLDALERP